MLIRALIFLYLALWGISALIEPLPATVALAAL